MKRILGLILAMAMLLSLAGVVGAESEQPALEKDVVLLAYQGELPDGTETLKHVALDPETLDLLSAELFLDGSLILALQAESFQWEGLAAG